MVRHINCTIILNLIKKDDDIHKLKKTEGQKMKDNTVNKKTLSGKTDKVSY